MTTDEMLEESARSCDRIFSEYGERCDVDALMKMAFMAGVTSGCTMMNSMMIGGFAIDVAKIRASLNL